MCVELTEYALTVVGLALDFHDFRPTMRFGDVVGCGPKIGGNYLMKGVLLMTVSEVDEELRVSLR